MRLAAFSVRSVAANEKDNKVTLASYELIGTLSIPTGTQFEDTEIGGLSSLAYDANRGVYYALSDDQGTIDPVRYYTLQIDVSDGQLDPGDITFVEVTELLGRQRRADRTPVLSIRRASPWRTRGSCTSPPKALPTALRRLPRSSTG